jgi:hypothetical protein
VNHKSKSKNTGESRSGPFDDPQTLVAFQLLILLFFDGLSLGVGSRALLFETDVLLTLFWWHIFKDRLGFNHLKLGFEGLYPTSG